MYFKESTKIPNVPGKITIGIRNGKRYINYEYSRYYNSEKKFNVPKRATIGKLCEDDDTMMYPNQNFVKYFPEIELSELVTSSSRSSCLKIGNYIVIKSIIESYKLDEILGMYFTKDDAGLVLDLATYSIITEGNQAQYYPDYAYNHPLFTTNMRQYSDSKISSFLSSITADQRLGFLNSWNEIQHKENIYISYDSTNKSSDAGDIEMIEYGNSKIKDGKPIVNYAIAYDNENSKPLFYEDYPGSIVDITQLSHTIDKAKAFGYEKIGFILDRGYFSKENINYLDKNNYDFIIMVKGMKSLVNEHILSKKNTFEEESEYSIGRYHCNGITIKCDAFRDNKARYLHIYYNYSKSSAERIKFEEKINKLEALFKSSEGKKIQFSESFEAFFNLEYDSEGTFLFAKKKDKEITKAIKLSGYYAIISSKEMTAAEALKLYKSRDNSEKLFRGDKTYLGNNSLRVHTTDTAKAKILVEFVALIIRNRMYSMLYLEGLTSKKANYLNVPAAIRKLEKIEMIRLMDNQYRLDHAITATQKAILKAFYIDDNYIKNKASELSNFLTKNEE